MPGPYYIAWADAGETFGLEHLVFDMRVLAFELQQSENMVATLDIVVQNPRRGLLNPDEQQWVFFSRENYHNDTVILWFYGRIVGVPENLVQNKVRLSFRAEPEDFQEMKEVYADTLKVLPWYDRL